MWAAFCNDISQTTVALATAVEAEGLKLNEHEEVLPHFVWSRPAR